MTTEIQRNGSRGEVSPDYYPRADVTAVRAGFKILRNYYVKKQGNVENRGGTQYQAEALDSTKRYRQIPFKFSNNDAYFLIFGDTTLHFIKNGQYVFDLSVALTACTNANPAVVTFTGTTIWATGDMVYLTGITGPMAQFLNNRYFLLNVVASGTPSTASLKYMDGTAVNSIAWGAGAFTNATINHVYKVATPYAVADLPLLKYSQSFNTMQLRHPSYFPQQLTRSGAFFTLGPTPYSPGQIPAVVGLASTVGIAGGFDYEYRVTTYNKTTGEESYPGCIYSPTGSVTKLIASVATSGQTATVTTTTNHGFTTGDTTVFNKNIFSSNGVGPVTPLLIQYGVTYVVTVTAVNKFTVQMAYYLPPKTGWILAGTNCTVTGTPAANKITVITQDFPAKLTTSAAHGLADGDPVLLTTTGVDGYDFQVFYVSVVDATNVYLNGINGANFALYGGSGGVISRAGIKISCKTPDDVNPNVITWALSSAQVALNQSNIEFVVYLGINGVFGFIGTTPTLSFRDTGFSPNGSRTPPQANPLFYGSGNYPGIPCYYEQRLMEFSPNNRPQGIFGSVIQKYSNFSTHNPLIDSDAIIGDVASNSLSFIAGVVDMGFLIILTDTKPFILSGGSNGTISPLSINAKNQAYLGASLIPQPLLIGKNILYVLADGSTVQDLQVLQTLYGSYIGDTDDVSILANHLTIGRTIVAWAFQQYPHPIIWIVFSDGFFVSVTYDFKNQINGWAQHYTAGGFVEDVCCVQNGLESVIQFTVRRTINGVTKRTFEKLALHYQADVKNYNFLDDSVTYDGRIWAGAALSYTLSSVGDWSVEDPNIIATASAPIFTASMVGQVLQFPDYLDANGNPIYFTIMSYTSTTVVGVAPSSDVPVGMQGVALIDSVLAIQTVYGLWNLEGKTVSVFADGYEASNGLIDPVPLVVANGSITLDAPYGVITVGLPIIADIETLSMDNPQAETRVDKKQLSNKVNVGVYKTRGLYLGPNLPALDAANPIEGLVEVKLREVGQGYYEPTDLATGFVQEIINGEWNFNQGVCLRQISPVPATITSIAPSWVDD